MRNASFRHRRDLSRPHPTHKIVLACWTRPNISTLNTGAADLGTLSAYGSILLLLAAQKAGKSAETEIDNYSSQAGPDAKIATSLARVLILQVARYLEAPPSQLHVGLEPYG
ncbi:uncharacterized protein BDCG_08464 [Blastomyces dermatitidis ER-3]|uniref:Uncharacterized protein n=1 Tax=Ajellomyces dermatitidis (strain ER-3 / ATCC MYA-2586) TaxID=559297 RepID=A0ABP2EP02_AJEDR|nr:uncharacterized protein BDCG_08464 [Blastomyces dermatitidis ER-3]EEQ85195.2 hypothetical protein BDCG_08464 [Blastomyces dermatitidis ER-3]